MGLDGFDGQTGLSWAVGLGIVGACPSGVGSAAGSGKMSQQCVVRAAETRGQKTEGREPGSVKLLENAISRSRGTTGSLSFLSGKQALRATDPS